MLTSVLEEVWKRVEVTRLLGEMERNLEVQRRIEKELVRRRMEEDELVKAVLSEEDKQKRKEMIMKIKRSWQNKRTAQGLRTLLRLTKRWSFEDLEMNVDILEEKAMELMDVGELEDQAQGDNNIMEMDIVVDIGLQHPNVSNETRGEVKKHSKYYFSTLPTTTISKGCEFPGVQIWGVKRKRESEDIGGLGIKCQKI